MGVYIKGMEMPKSCFVCPCYHHKVDDGYYDYEICRASGTVFNDGYASVTGHKNHIDPFKARLDNCPLVPVPPHGDLFDISKVKITPSDDEDIAYEIDFGNTVIPAEPFNNLSKPFKDDEDIPICTKASPASLGIYKKAEEDE